GEMSGSEKRLPVFGVLRYGRFAQRITLSCNHRGSGQMKFVLAVAFVATIVVANVAHAQTVPVEPSPGASLVASSSLTSTIGVPITGVGVAIYGIYTTVRGGAGGDANAKAAAEAFLRQ